MTGIVLLNMGGPDSLDAVRPFLYNLFSDRDIIQLGPSFLQPLIAWSIARKRAPKSRAAYEKIGGRSPLADITARQADALQSLLNSRGAGRVIVASGMRYWHPRTIDALKGLKAQGVKKVLGLSLYPHYSRATSGTSLRDFKKAAASLGLDATSIDCYPDHPGYVAALAQAVTEGERRLRREAESFTLVYSAHSLPKSMIDQGDPYVDHLHRTISALEALTGIRGRLCFQSRSGPVEWLEPATDVMLNELASRGEKALLVLPISFVSDHIETLYEIDMLYGDMMAKRGVRLLRTQSLNDNALFISALADMALEKIKEEGWQG